jgi:hypothetical protein
MIPFHASNMATAALKDRQTSRQHAWVGVGVGVGVGGGGWVWGRGKRGRWRAFRRRHCLDQVRRAGRAGCTRLTLTRILPSHLIMVVEALEIEQVAIQLCLGTGLRGILWRLGRVIAVTGVESTSALPVGGPEPHKAYTRQVAPPTSSPLPTGDNSTLQVQASLPFPYQSSMHTQQNSFLQPLFLHTMWLQPWFFSMRARHFGHFLVLARIQFTVSDSFEHFSCHRISCRAPNQGVQRAADQVGTKDQTQQATHGVTERREAVLPKQQVEASTRKPRWVTNPDAVNRLVSFVGALETGGQDNENG